MRRERDDCLFCRTDWFSVEEMRIPTKSITDSDGNRSPVPTETDHLSEPATRDLES